MLLVSQIHLQLPRSPLLPRTSSTPSTGFACLLKSFFTTRRTKVFTIICTLPQLWEQACSVAEQEGPSFATATTLARRLCRGQTQIMWMHCQTENRRQNPDKRERIRRKTGEEGNLPGFFLLHSWPKDIRPVSCDQTSNVSPPMVEPKVAGSLSEVEVVEA